MEHIEVNVSWLVAVQLYIEILMNSADPTGAAVLAAKQDLKRLAKLVDDLKASEHAGDVVRVTDPNQMTLAFD